MTEDLDHGGMEEREAISLMLHEEITDRILAAAIKVHTALGAGCLESTYDACVCDQLRKDGVRFDHQVRVPIVYDGVRVDAGYRIDFLIENCVILELKAVEKLLPLHVAQVLTYLKLSGHEVGLLVNFNVPHLRHGIRRVMHPFLVSSVVDRLREFSALLCFHYPPSSRKSIPTLPIFLNLSYRRASRCCASIATTSASTSSSALPTRAAAAAGFVCAPPM